MNPPSRIAVTGIGLTTSLGAGVPDNWRRLCAGESGFSEIEIFDVDDATVTDGGLAPLPPGVDEGALFKDGRLRSRVLYEVTIREALASAGLGGPDASRLPDPERTALVLGSSLAASASNGTFWEGFLGEAGPAGADYSTLQSYDVEPLLSELAATFGILGETVLVANACAAGASAVAIGRELLAAGEADRVVIAGGDPLELHTFAGFHSLGLLTPEPLQPFRAERRGMKLGDGFAALVLEREGHRDATPRAWLVGAGESADAHSLTQPHPQGKGAALAMRRALTMAGKAATDVDFVSLHATSTPGNDGSEYHALHEVFGDGMARVRMHAAKPSMGHTLGAAGTVEAVLSVCVLEHQFVPATLGDGELDPSFAGFRFPDQSEPVDVRYAMTNSFGFGGSNASLLFERASAEVPS